MMEQNMKGLLFYLFLVIPGMILGALAGVALVSVSTEPQLLNQSFSRDAYSRGEQWLEHLHDAFKEDRLNRITLKPEDISDLAVYSVSRFKLAGKPLVILKGIRTEFFQDHVNIQMTLKPVQTDYYLNITLSISEQEGLPRWEYMQLGYGYWPGSLMSWGFVNLLLPILPPARTALWNAMVGAVEQFVITPGQLSLVYRSDEELRYQLKSQASALMNSSPQEREVLQLYLNVMASFAEQQQGPTLSLAEIMHGMFGLAKARSEEGRAVIENARLIRALAIQVASPQVRSLLAPGIQPEALGRPLVLRGEQDLGQHFLVSAALALALDEETALHIGIGKEQADANPGGSGFSMTDLVANMAGIRFASVATRDEQQARRLQELMIRQQGDSIFMPRVDWLPANISARAYAELLRHPLYPAMLDKAIKRLNALPVYTEIEDTP